MRAERQTAGRGRRGRPWVPLPGNLFASALVLPQAGEGPAQQLSFVAALALEAALRDYVPTDRLALKWPNDVLLDGGKVAGILLERSGAAVVIGFGGNLADAPADVEGRAVSVAGQGLAAPAAGVFVETLAAKLTEWRQRWTHDGFATIRAAWLARATGLGAPITVRLGDRELAGVFTGLAADGALELKCADGSLTTIYAGEVFGL